MGKMRMGPKVTRLGQSRSEIPMSSDMVVDPGLSRDEVNDLLDLRIKSLELLPQPVVPETIIERTEVVKEVSVVTKDSKSRAHTRLVSKSLKQTKINIDVLRKNQEATDRDLLNTKELVYKLRSELAELDRRERTLELQIPEEKQEVRQSNQTLLYLCVVTSLLLSLADLILN